MTKRPKRPSANDDTPSLRPPTRLHRGEASELLFITASHIVDAAQRAGRAQQTKVALTDLPARLEVTGFWDLHYDRPVSPETVTRWEETNRLPDHGESALLGLLEGLTHLCAEVDLRAAVETVMQPHTWPWK